MSTVTTQDGIQIYYKDWGEGQPIVFSHGWPLSADDWDAQMMFFLNRGYRVIAHDRRGHGRSSQGGDGHDMDHYADDLAALTAHLDLDNAIHVGHSTGGGEVTRYIARHGLPGAGGHQPGAILFGRAGWTFLWIQPTGRESIAGCDSELVAPGNDGRRQGAL